jgi:ABC-2 type transport system ATP-binding protein
MTVLRTLRDRWRAGPAGALVATLLVLGLIAGPGAAPAAASTPAPSTSDAPAPVTADLRVEQLRIPVPGGPGVEAPIELDATLYLPETTPAPAVLIAHGFGGSKASVDADARDLAARGLVALAWSARGFGTSGGQIALNSPDY